jgi:hypothetical protein
MKKYGWAEPGVLAERSSVPLTVILEAARQVEERRLAVREGMDLVLTDRGRAIAERLAQAREDSLADLLGNWWTSDRPTDLTQLVKELNEELCGSERERPRNGAAGRAVGGGV